MYYGEQLSAGLEHARDTRKALYRFVAQGTPMKVVVLYLWDRYQPDTDYEEEGKWLRDTWTKAVAGCEAARGDLERLAALGFYLQNMAYWLAFHPNVDSDWLRRLRSTYEGP